MKNIGKIWVPLIVLVIAITALILSIVTFPLFMGGWATLCVIGAGMMIVGSIFGILRVVENQKFGRIANGLFGWLTGVGTGIFLLTLLVIGMIAMANNFNKNFNATATTVPAATTAAAVDNAGATVPAATTAAAAETTAASTDVAFKPEVAKGETISANKEFQVQAGDVVSGDVYYVTADDVAVPIMDDDSTTALITYFTEGARLRTGDTWSVYLVHQPSQTEIDNLITEKQKENFERVDYILFPATQAQSSK